MWKIMALGINPSLESGVRGYTWKKYDNMIRYDYDFIKSDFHLSPAREVSFT